MSYNKAALLKEKDDVNKKILSYQKKLTDLNLKKTHLEKEIMEINKDIQNEQKKIPVLDGKIAKAK